MNGETSSETRTASVMVSIVELVMPERVADTVVAPTSTPVARPWLPAAFEIVATDSSEEAQVTSIVRSCVEPSEKMPVAVKC